jgi:hypothetical protein
MAHRRYRGNSGTPAHGLLGGDLEQPGRHRSRRLNDYETIGRPAVGAQTDEDRPQPDPVCTVM